MHNWRGLFNNAVRKQEEIPLDRYLMVWRATVNRVSVHDCLLATNLDQRKRIVQMFDSARQKNQEQPLTILLPGGVVLQAKDETFDIESFEIGRSECDMVRRLLSMVSVPLGVFQQILEFVCEDDHYNIEVLNWQYYEPALKTRSRK